MKERTKDVIAIGFFALLGLLWFFDVINGVIVRSAIFAGIAGDWYRVLKENKQLRKENEALRKKSQV